MRIDTKFGQAVSPCTFDRFLHALGHPERAMAGPPASLRRQTAERPFASFDNVLTLQPPASRDMAKRVAQMRDADHQARPDLQLLARNGQTAGERRLLFAIGVTVAVFAARIIFGVAVAHIAERL
jgi:hypothetical protein